MKKEISIDFNKRFMEIYEEQKNPNGWVHMAVHYDGNEKKQVFLNDALVDL